MASRSERREAARLEAGLKLAVFAVVALALLVGGVSGFAGALTALVFLGVVVGVTELTGFLILRSRLVPKKKAGLLLVIAALLTAWFWSGARAPRQWLEERATVTSISGPTAVTETDYSYHTDEAKKGAALSITQTKSWSKLSEAKG